MKCGILTFYFAHNYGAVLQAVALRDYLISTGNEVEVIDFVPQKLQNEYSLNPFARSHNPKAVIKRFIHLPKRYKQYMLFQKFINKEFMTKPRLGSYDIVFFGSDQIWNEKITGEIYTYFGEGIADKIQKVAYAASFGSSNLSEFQKGCCKLYLPRFKNIALRETDVIAAVSKLSDKEVVSVMDPVFLLNRGEWEVFASHSKNKDERYILYYVLRNDPQLISETSKLEKKYGYRVICIHPTGNDLAVNWKQLYNIGPYEFVDLIRKAEVVATNSFHAMAFSVIFGKKAKYRAYSSTESRVPSLLSLCDAKRCLDSDGVYNFELLDDARLIHEQKKSQSYIYNVLETV